MKRREFSLACGAAVAGAAWVGSAALAQGATPQPGVDFVVLDKATSVDAPAGRIEVVEFFGYFCPHCNSFEPTFDAWTKRAAKDVFVRRVPVAFQSALKPQQHLYYALEAMGLVDKLHRKVFAAIHVDKVRLDSLEPIADWVAKQGVDRAKFVEHFNSFSVATNATKATRLHNDYKIDGVPSLGVAGRFLTDGTMAKGMERALQVVDFLTATVRAGH